MTRLSTMTLFLTALFLAACSSAAPASDAGFATPISNQTELHVDDTAHDHADLPAGELTVVLIPTELVAGPNRFAVGLFDTQQALIHEADVHFRYFDLSDPTLARPEQETGAQRLQTPDGQVTIFTHERDFTRIGNWGVEVTAQLPGGTRLQNRIGFEVLADSPSVTPGENVPAITTPTLSDVDQELGLLTSARQPDPSFYGLSLDQAVTNGRPTLLLFATPEFCQTRFCGPAYDTFSDLQKRYGQQINFIHVEVFAGLPNPANKGFKLSPPVEAFGLSSDPWLYLIAKNGEVLYRVEGLFTAAEIEQQLLARLAL